MKDLFIVIVSILAFVINIVNFSTGGWCSVASVIAFLCILPLFFTSLKKVYNQIKY